MQNDGYPFCRHFPALPENCGPYYSLRPEKVKLYHPTRGILVTVMVVPLNLGVP